ncbi:MAG: hypothetical protein OXG49_10140 [Chloroflexi bacterium]|nr:hypothetical protein [Chloroflexota bacterium]
MALLTLVDQLEAFLRANSWLPLDEWGESIHFEIKATGSESDNGINFMTYELTLYAKYEDNDQTQNVLLQDAVRMAIENVKAASGDLEPEANIEGDDMDRAVIKFSDLRWLI